jgi:hypothetical protein
VAGAVVAVVGLDLGFIQVRKWVQVLLLLLVLEVLEVLEVRVAVLEVAVVLAAIHKLTPVEQD